MVSLKVAVKTLANDLFDVEVASDSTVAGLKHAIADKTGIPVTDQKLIAQGRPLKDGAALQDGLPSDKKVHLLNRIPADTNLNTYKQPAQNQAGNGPDLSKVAAMFSSSFADPNKAMGAESSSTGEKKPGVNVAALLGGLSSIMRPKNPASGGQANTGGTGTSQNQPDLASLASAFLPMMMSNGAGASAGGAKSSASTGTGAIVKPQTLGDIIAKYDESGSLLNDKSPLVIIKEITVSEAMGITKGDFGPLDREQPKLRQYLLEEMEGDLSEERKALLRQQYVEKSRNYLKYPEKHRERLIDPNTDVDAIILENYDIFLGQFIEIGLVDYSTVTAEEDKFGATLKGLLGRFVGKLVAELKVLMKDDLRDVNVVAKDVAKELIFGIMGQDQGLMIFMFASTMIPQKLSEAYQYYVECESQNEKESSEYVMKWEAVMEVDESRQLDLATQELSEAYLQGDPYRSMRSQ